jgi:hypothetical protein
VFYYSRGIIISWGQAGLIAFRILIYSNNDTENSTKNYFFALPVLTLGAGEIRGWKLESIPVIIGISAKTSCLLFLIVIV